MRVLYVSAGYTTHDRRFLDSFAGAGWDVAHLPLLQESLDRRPLPDGVRGIEWPGEAGNISDASHWESQADAMTAVIRREMPAVVVAGPVHAGALAAARAGARPLVTVSWGSDLLVDSFRDDQMREATRFTLEHSDAVFGDCRAVREAVHSHSTFRDDRIVTFPWGIDLERFSPRGIVAPVVEDRGWSDDDDVFISTRTWEPLYAIDVLVEAFAMVLAARPGARLILLGDGSLCGSVQRRIDELEIRDFVHTPGRLPYEELPAFFRAATAYVSSALSDGTSVSLLEAMACGLPVVVTGSYGNLEWVTEGVNGALAEAGDAESLAAAMLRATSDSAARSAMGAANISIAQARADWRSNFPVLRRLVESLVPA